MSLSRLGTKSWPNATNGARLFVIHGSGAHLLQRNSPIAAARRSERVLRIGGLPQGWRESAGHKVVRGGVQGAVRYPTTVIDAAIALRCRIIAAQRPRTEFFKRFQLPSSAPSAMTLLHCLCSGAEHCTAQARRSVRPPIGGFGRTLHRPCSEAPFETGWCGRFRASHTRHCRANWTTKRGLAISHVSMRGAVR
jgi:hypothetical protein